MMGRLSKSISISISGKDKKSLQTKAEELSISLSALIRNIVLNKYQNLQIGYISYSSIKAKHDIDIRGLRPPGKPRTITKEHISMKECVKDLKIIFSQGLNILSKIDDSELGIKSREVAQELGQKIEFKTNNNNPINFYYKRIKV